MSPRDGDEVGVRVERKAHFRAKDRALHGPPATPEPNPTSPNTTFVSNEDRPREAAMATARLNQLSVYARAHARGRNLRKPPQPCRHRGSEPGDGYMHDRECVRSMARRSANVVSRARWPHPVAQHFAPTAALLVAFAFMPGRSRRPLALDRGDSAPDLTAARVTECASARSSGRAIRVRC